MRAKLPSLKITPINYTDGGFILSVTGNDVAVQSEPVNLRVTDKAPIIIKWIHHLCLTLRVKRTKAALHKNTRNAPPAVLLTVRYNFPLFDHCFTLMLCCSVLSLICYLVRWWFLLHFSRWTEWQYIWSFHSWSTQRCSNTLLIYFFHVIYTHCGEKGFISMSHLELKLRFQA